MTTRVGIIFKQAHSTHCRTTLCCKVFVMSVENTSQLAVETHKTANSARITYITMNEMSLTISVFANTFYHFLILNFKFPTGVEHCSQHSF